MSILTRPLYFHWKSKF